jgi:pyruvate dehydrogenase E2 component (dihydrolipoamide acetyltransferase)
MRRNWTIGLCLTLLLIGGFAFEASAQTPPAPATPSAPAAPSEPAKPAPDATPQPAAPSQMQKAPDAPAPSTQTETRTERVVEHERTFLGVDPTVAMILGAALLIVIVFAMVAMSRRRDEVEHTHVNQPRI